MLSEYMLSNLTKTNLKRKDKTTTIGTYILRRVMKTPHPQIECHPTSHPQKGPKSNPATKPLDSIARRERYRNSASLPLASCTARCEQGPATNSRRFTLRTPHLQSYIYLPSPHPPLTQCSENNMCISVYI